jgi:hypothetical protein
MSSLPFVSSVLIPRIAYHALVLPVLFAFALQAFPSESFSFPPRARFDIQRARMKLQVASCFTAYMSQGEGRRGSLRPSGCAPAVEEGRFFPWGPFLSRPLKRVDAPPSSATGGRRWFGMVVVAVVAAVVVVVVVVDLLLCVGYQSYAGVKPFFPGVGLIHLSIMSNIVLLPCDFSRPYHSLFVLRVHLILLLTLLLCAAYSVPKQTPP